MSHSNATRKVMMLQARATLRMHRGAKKRCGTSYEVFFTFSTTLLSELMLHDPLDVHREDFATDVFARSVPTTKVFKV